MCRAVPQTHRIDTLEGVRGLAAVIVFFYHWILGFLPQFSGVFSGFPPEQAMVGRFGFFFINGPGAVIFFFVLSGFVLSRKVLLTYQPEQIVVAALKRWPRLAFPTVMACFISWLFFHYDFYHYQEAAALTHSPWLASFAGAFVGAPPNVYSLRSALEQGGFLTFFRGDFYYDSSIWTMHYEFVASFMIFGLCLFLLVFRTLPKWVALLPIFIVMQLSDIVSSLYFPFFIGLLAAYFLPINLKISPFLRVFILAVGLYILGYFSLSGLPIGRFTFQYQYIDAVGSVLVFMACYDVRLTAWPQRIAQCLGQLSFPFYLLHALMLCSFGAWLFVLLKTQGWPHPSFLVGFATFWLSIAVSVPFIKLNSLWMQQLNRVLLPVTKRLTQIR